MSQPPEQEQPRERVGAPIDTDSVDRWKNDPPRPAGEPRVRRRGVDYGDKD